MLRTIKLTTEKKNMTKTPDELYNYCTLKLYGLQINLLFLLQSYQYILSEMN